ncbi:MAG: carbohydrate kinase family protein [Anaerolineae bacterium]
MTLETKLTPEFIAVGALNEDYYGPYDLRYRLSAAIQTDLEGRRECLVNDTQVDKELANVGKAAFGGSTAGGSALNTARTIESLGLGVRVGFVGVLGGSPDGVIEAAIKQLDTTLVIRYADTPPGRCLVFRRGSDTRLLVAPGANVRVEEAFAQPALTEYLAAARWIHVSSFHHRAALRVLAEAIDRARNLNASLIVSFDPGDEYTERLRGLDDSTGKEGPPFVEEFLAKCDFVFLNGKEARNLARVSGRRRVESRVLGEEIFKVAGERCRLVIVKNRSSHIVFQRRILGTEKVVLVRRWWHLRIPLVIDDVGAGDVFAGGFIAAHLRPYFVELGKGPSRLGASLVRARLVAKHGIPFADFKGVTNKQLDIARRERWNLRDFLAVYGPPALTFVAGALLGRLLGGW